MTVMTFCYLISSFFFYSVFLMVKQMKKKRICDYYYYHSILIPSKGFYSNHLIHRHYSNYYYLLLLLLRLRHRLLLLPLLLAPPPLRHLLLDPLHHLQRIQLRYRYRSRSKRCSNHRCYRSPLLLWTHVDVLTFLSSTSSISCLSHHILLLLLHVLLCHLSLRLHSLLMIHRAAYRMVVSAIIVAKADSIN